MKNRDFIALLRGEKDVAGKPYTIEVLAAGICSGRAHVNQVLRNRLVDGRPRFGHQTRRRLVKFFKGNFRAWPAMLSVLGWGEDGEIKNQAPAGTAAAVPYHAVPHGTFDVEQTAK